MAGANAPRVFNAQLPMARVILKRDSDRRVMDRWEALVTAGSIRLQPVTTPHNEALCCRLPADVRLREIP